MCFNMRAQKISSRNQFMIHNAIHLGEKVNNSFEYYALINVILCLLNF